jgi:hypothetical protein
LPALLALWVNLHSLFVLGLVVIGIYALGRLIERRRIDRPLAVWGALSAAACFLTPYFRTVAVFPVKQLAILRGGLIKSDLVGTAEFLSPFRLDLYDLSGRFVWWQPTLFIHLYVAIVLVAAVIGWRRHRVVDWLLLAAFGYLFAQAIKNQGYFVIATLPAAAAALGTPGRSRSSGGRGRDPGRTPGRVAIAASAATVLLSAVVALQVSSGYWYGSRRSPHRLGGGFNEKVLPVRAARFLARSFDRPWPILNNWDAGGYLGFATGWPVFIDGRNEIMGEEFYREYLAFKDPQRLAGLLERHGIRLALVPHVDLPVWYHSFAISEAWSTVYLDERQAVFAHRSVPGPPALPPPLPGVDYPEFSGEEADAILHAASGIGRPGFLGSLFGRHHEPLGRLAWSLVRLRTGQPRAAVGHALAGLRDSTFPAPELFATLGHAYYDLGDLDRAAFCFRVALADVDDALARRRLTRIDRLRGGAESRLDAPGTNAWDGGRDGSPPRGGPVTDR